MEQATRIRETLKEGPLHCGEISSRLQMSPRTLRHWGGLMEAAGAIERKRGVYNLKVLPTVEVPPLPEVTPNNSFWAKIFLTCMVGGTLSYTAGLWL